MMPYNQLPYPADNFQHFAQLVKTAFSQRRKTLHNNLKGIMDTSQLATIDIDTSLRPERLTVADYVKISNYHQNS